MLGATAAGLAHAVDLWPATTPGGFRDKGIVLMLALASGFFVAAGVLRLAKWRLAHDAHSALVGTALMVMGGLCLPLGGFAQLFMTSEASLLGPSIRSLASFVAIYLVVRALHTTEASPRDHPGRLLPRVFALVTVTFLALLLAQDQVPALLSGELPVMLMAAARSLGWFAVAVHAAMLCEVVPWARRAAPLFLGMGIAETLRAFDQGRMDSWTFGGVMLCASMAALAARSALLDLDVAVRADQDQLTDLSAALGRVSGRADEMVMWREQLTHDARNACAGLRAAMDILERYDGRVDPSITERLRVAALQEIGHIEHLLTRSSTQPSHTFEVTEVVRAVGDAARALGAQVAVHGAAVEGTGRAEDLAAVLKNLLVNAQTHAPDSRVDIEVTADDETVTITCSDDGPGLSNADTARLFERGYRAATSPGSGLGLYAARELMRERGGDLRLGLARQGATFLVTLPVARPARTPATVPRVPAQRTMSFSPTAHALEPSDRS